MKSGKGILKCFIFGTLFSIVLYGAAFAVSDESLAARSGDKVETRPLNPDHVAAINKVADYLDKMGSKDTGNKLRADFKSGRVYIGKVGGGANAEVNPGALGAGRSMAISDMILNQMGTDRVKASGANVASWALTIFHEYIHMDQLLPMETSMHETSAWAATLRKNGQWIRWTIDKIAPAGANTTLTPEERVARLQELRQTLIDLQGPLDVTLNEMRGKLKTGDLDKAYKWKGVPPAGGGDATGTTNIDILEAYAHAQIQAGLQEIDRLLADAKKVPVEELKTVKISDSEEVTGYFQGDKLIKRHGTTKRFEDGKLFEEDDYQDGKKVGSRGYNAEKGNMMVESVWCGDLDNEFECKRTEYSWDGKVEFEKRRLTKDSKEQIKTSTGEWF